MKIFLHRERKKIQKNRRNRKSISARIIRRVIVMKNNNLIKSVFCGGNL